VPDRHDLTDEEWAGLQPLLPDRAPRHGGRWADDRQMINGVFFRTRTGTPWGDLPAVPRAAWLRSLRRVLTEAPNERFGNPAGAAFPNFAEYLNRVRGTSATADATVICNRYVQGVAMIAP
jgi:transposase